MMVDAAGTLHSDTSLSDLELDSKPQVCKTVRTSAQFFKKFSVD